MQGHPQLLSFFSKGKDNPLTESQIWNLTSLNPEELARPAT